MIVLSLIALAWALWKIHLLRLKIWALTQQRDEARDRVRELTAAGRHRPAAKTVESFVEVDTFGKSKRLDRSRRGFQRYGTAAGGLGVG